MIKAEVSKFGGKGVRLAPALYIRPRYGYWAYSPGGWGCRLYTRDPDVALARKADLDQLSEFGRGKSPHWWRPWIARLQAVSWSDDQWSAIKNELIKKLACERPETVLERWAAIQAEKEATP